MTAPFRAGRVAAARQAQPHFTGLTSPSVLLADVSEFEPQVADPVYLAWSQAIVIRAAYGTSHQDRAWYGGDRRALLHEGGCRFLGIYQYLVAGQDGAAQADALCGIIRAPQPGEVITPDFEEGQHAMLTAWYNRMLNNLGQDFRPYLWTYTGLNFGRDRGALPVEWVAAYQAVEPATPHKLWQFTDSFRVPGVGVADCSVFRGTIDELAAMTYQGAAPAPAPPPVPAVSWSQWPPSLTLRQGDSGPAVKVLQTALRNSGIYGVRGITADGVFGQQTETALRNYQLHQFGPAAVDGIAGPRTRSALLALGDL